MAFQLDDGSWVTPFGDPTPPKSTPPREFSGLRRLRKCSLPDPFAMEPMDPKHKSTSYEYKPEQKYDIYRRCQYCHDWVSATKDRMQNGFCFSHDQMFHRVEERKGPREECVRCHQPVYWNERRDCPNAPRAFCDAW
jgi:hypothetical protein